MTLSFCILGSGSGGNSTLVSMNGGGARRFALIDAGLSPRMTARRIRPLGVALSDISDIILTHLDRDHFSLSWIKASEKHDIRLRFHRRHRTRAMRAMMDFKRVTLFEDSFELGQAEANAPGCATIDCVHFAHDDLGTVGFVIEHDSLRLGFATDVGHVPESLFDCFCDLHALAIESNYDREMQLSSGRPAYLKKRIMGGRGHLCNDQSIEAVMHIAAQSQLSHIALLHLSRQCNCPRLVTSLYARKAPHLLGKLTVSNQFEPTPVLHVTMGEQSPLPPDVQVPRRSQQMVLF